MHYQPAPEGKDSRLWQLAHKRVTFKRHLFTYTIVNLFFWILWYFIRVQNDYKFDHEFIPWPVWPMLGWGIGVLFHFIGAYVSTGQNSVEREYEKLKSQNK